MDSPQETSAALAAVKERLSPVLSLNGLVAATIIDPRQGNVLAQFHLQAEESAVLASATSEIYETAKDELAEDSEDSVQEVLISLQAHYHLLRTIRLPSQSIWLLHLILDQQSANLGMARHRLGEFSSRMQAA